MWRNGAEEMAKIKRTETPVDHKKNIINLVRDLSRGRYGVYSLP
ncbi:hypothetical protein ES703_09175 [subsurface metagenome]